MFSLPSVLTVVSAVLYFKEKFHGIIIKYFGMMVVEHILLVFRYFLILPIDCDTFPLVSTKYPVVVVIEKSILYHAITPHIGNFPIIGEPQGFISFFLQHSWSRNAAF